ncbi:MAG: NAD(P)H-dependent oxidoreductase [Leeuwenhoekiella sp.]
MNNYIDALNWRYAVKKFDPSKRISKENLDALKTSVQLSASSYGLQPYKILIVQDDEVKAKMKDAGFDQTQFTDASEIFVFAHQTDFGAELVDSYIAIAEKTKDLESGSLEGYSNMMKNALLDLPQEGKAAWAAKQAYLALGNLLSAAAAYKIDACPMEGFNSESFNEILNLKDKNLHAAAVVAVGYRSEDDKHQHDKKVRRPQTELIKTI